MVPQRRFTDWNDFINHWIHVVKNFISRLTENQQELIPQLSDDIDNGEAPAMGPEQLVNR
jgi:hypothetical protein